MILPVDAICTSETGKGATTMSQRALVILGADLREVKEALEARGITVTDISLDVIAVGIGEGKRVIKLEGLEIDPISRIVKVDGETTPLTKKGFDLLYFLASQPGRVLSREAIIEGVWGDQGTRCGSRTLDVHIARLRKVLGSAGRHIVTVLRMGIRFDLPSE
jgi:DNA-binding response OmpR family regulator